MKKRVTSKRCAKISINVDFDIKNDNERAAGLVVNIRSGLSKENDKIEEIRANNEKEDAEQEKEIREHREQGVKLKSEKDSLTKQIKESQSTLNEQNKQLLSIKQRANTLNSIQQQIINIDAVILERQNMINTQGLQEEIEQHREEKQELSEKLEGFDDTITCLSTMASVLADVNTKKKHLEKQETEVKRLKNKHRDNFERLFPDETLESNFKRKIDGLNQKLNLESNKLDAKIRLKETQSNNFKTKLQMKKQEVNNLENELRRLQENIDKVCEQTPFEEVRATTRENVDKYQMEHSSFKSAEVFYKKYIKKVEEMDKPCCPLCHKDLVGNEATHLTTELNDQIDMLPMNIERTGKALKEESIKLEKLIGLQTSVERVEKLQSDLIPQVKEDIKNLERDLSAAQDEIKKTKPGLDEVKEKLSIAQLMIGDMSMLDAAMNDVEQARRDLEPLNQTISSLEGSNDTSLEDLQKQRKELTDRIKYLGNEITRKEKTFNDRAKELNSLKERKLGLQQSEVELKADLQKVDALKNRVKELNEQIKELNDKKDACDQSLIPIEAKIKLAEDKRRRIRAANSDKLNAATKHYDSLKKEFNEIERISNELRKLAALDLAAEIERQNDDLVRLREEEKKIVAEITSLDEMIKGLNKEIADQQNKERELQDNLELKRIQKKITEKERELEQLRKDEQEVDFAQITQKKVALQRQIEAIIIERERIKGQMAEKDNSIRKLNDEVNQPKYRDSIRNYKKAYYENVVLSKTVDDLTTYCETLEKALTKFHSDKMEKINGLIRDFWRNIYKGNDIDFIQINTEEVKGTAKRRSYTYRVVASKNDTFMDFRGQSSAGQRVLACLIIRIALAETFSGHCGVLALDEPTTNLDKINITSLCEALNHIVEDRENQRNFMLIVITHDEEFINSMGRINSYWRVSRDLNGKSRTQKLRVN